MVEWSRNPDYPTKRGECSFCGHKDELKLSFDRIHFICIKDHACVLRWRKEHEANRERLNDDDA